MASIQITPEVSITSDPQTMEILTSNQSPEEKAKALLGGYTEEEIQRAWDRVSPAENWKAPIEAACYCSPQDADLIAFAITFYTASIAEVEQSESYDPVGPNGEQWYIFRAAGAWAMGV